MSTRPSTLQDVAVLAGVHRTTVSLALRDHPRIPDATRERIQKLARKLGYKANPLVTALMRSRRTGKAVKHAVLAYVTNHPTRFGWRPPELQEPDFFPGAVERAKEFGYKVEHFWMAEPGMTSTRFCEILRARDIHGILVGRLPANLNHLAFQWEHFSNVALGLTLASPQLHHMIQSNYFSTHMSMQQCFERGYRRIGFAFSTPNNYPRVGDLWLGGYFSKQHLLQPKNRIPIYESGHDDREAFLAWFRRWKPDAIIVSKAIPVLDWLKRAGIRVPFDVGIVELRNECPELGHSGVHYDVAKVGALGVEMLLGLMHRGERGIPSVPHEVSVPGIWLEGRTLPRRH